MTLSFQLSQQQYITTEQRLCASGGCLCAPPETFANSALGFGISISVRTPFSSSQLCPPPGAAASRCTARRIGRLCGAVAVSPAHEYTQEYVLSSCEPCTVLAYSCARVLFSHSPNSIRRRTRVHAAPVSRALIVVASMAAGAGGAGAYPSGDVGGALRRLVFSGGTVDVRPLVRDGPSLAAVVGRMRALLLAAGVAPEWVVGVEGLGCGRALASALAADAGARLAFVGGGGLAEARPARAGDPALLRLIEGGGEDDGGGAGAGPRGGDSPVFASLEGRRAVLVSDWVVRPEALAAACEAVGAARGAVCAAIVIYSSVTANSRLELPPPSSPRADLTPSRRPRSASVTSCPVICVWARRAGMPHPRVAAATPGPADAGDGRGAPASRKRPRAAAAAAGGAPPAARGAARPAPDSAAAAGAGAAPPGAGAAVSPPRAEPPSPVVDGRGSVRSCPRPSPNAGGGGGARASSPPGRAPSLRHGSPSVRGDCGGGGSGTVAAAAPCEALVASACYAANDPCEDARFQFRDDASGTRACGTCRVLRACMRVARAPACAAVVSPPSRARARARWRRAACVYGGGKVL